MWQLLLRFAVRQLEKEAVRKVAQVASQQATGRGLSPQSANIFLQALGGSKVKGPKGFGDLMYKASGKKEHLSTAYKRAKNNSLGNFKSGGRRKTKSPGKQTKDLFRVETLKTAFKKLSGQYLRSQLKFAGQQSKNSNPLWAIFRVNQQVSDARQNLSDIMSREVLGNKKVVDSAILSSSWCHRGTGYGTQENALTGTLELTTKIARYKNKRLIGFKQGKTYNYQNMPLYSGVLMKQAMGGFGTGAGSVFGRTYLRGYQSGQVIPPYGGSEQVTH